MRVAIRADASRRIGSGHVVRCAALAETLKAAGCEVLFVTRDLPGHLGEWLHICGHAVALLPPPDGSVPDSSTAHGDWLEVPIAKDVEDVAAGLADWGRPDWLVVDHYALDRTWEQMLRPAVGRILVVDDLADRPHDCDVLLNQNLNASAEQYLGQIPPHCRLLLGPRYALLRRQFAEARVNLRLRDGHLRRLLICFGGADADNATALAIEGALTAGIERLAIDVVVGGANPHRAALECRIADRPNVRLLCDVKDMAELMVKADLFLGSGGGMTWERAALGLPGITVAIAPNQISLCRSIAEVGADIFLGPIADVNADEIAVILNLLARQPDWLKSLTTRFVDMTDGRGAKRAALAMDPPRFTLRLARLDDCDDVFQWRNDDAVRRYSGDSQRVALDRHRTWYTACLADPNRALLIAEQPGPGSMAEPLAVLRFDLSGSRAVISIYLVPGQHGRGLGTELLLRGEDWLRLHHRNVTEIEALVHVDNVTSLSAFCRAGYARQCELMIKKL